MAGGGGAASSEVEGWFSSECSLSLASVLTLLDAACPSGVDGVEWAGLLVFWRLKSGSDGGGVESGDGLSGETEGRDGSWLSETESR